ncbi:MAG: protein PhnA [Bacteroidia bacterium]|jgi:protein PhnA
MSLLDDLKTRSNNVCELCSSEDELSSFLVSPKTEGLPENCIAVCTTCKTQLEDEKTVDANHWRCLNDSMWSPVPVVKVVAYRMLNQLRNEGWPVDLLEMIYMEEDELNWAKQGVLDGTEEIHRDANGNALKSGDSVTLIKNLDVKGANFTAKRGTAVRNIKLVANNTKHIEGRVNDQQIVIITEYVKKN